MISKKDIITMARRVRKRAKGRRDARLIHPYREWFIGIALFFVVAAVGGFFTAQEHVYYNNIESYIDESEVDVNEYLDDVALFAIQRYTDRQQTFESLATEVPAGGGQTATSSPATTDTTSDEDANETSSDTSPEELNFE